MPMRLHITPECITVNIHEHSSHFLHVSDTLAKNFSKTFWINETLINLPSQKEMQKRKEFLISLYYICAQTSQTHNMAFLQKLIALHDKPIKVVQKRTHKPMRANNIPFEHYYTVLDAHHEESLQSIRKKYLRLAKTYHPDHNTHTDSLSSYTQKFQQIQEAYEAIKTLKSKKRAA